METSQTRDCAWKIVIDNKHKHTIIATLSVKKGSKFTDPDAQFPRGGALACARGFPIPFRVKGFCGGKVLSGTVF